MLDFERPDTNTLLASFRTHAAQDTSAVGSHFAPVLRRNWSDSILAGKTRRVAFSGRENAGKKTLITGIMHVLKKPDYLSLDVSQISVGENFKTITQSLGHSIVAGLVRHLDCAVTGEHQLDNYNKAPNEFGSFAGLDLVENPHLYRHRSLLDAWFRMERSVTNEGISICDIDLYATDEIAVMPEFQKFLEDAADLRIR